MKTSTAVSIISSSTSTRTQGCDSLAELNRYYSAVQEAAEYVAVGLWTMKEAIARVIKHA